MHGKTHLYSSHRAFKIYRRGREDVRCKKIGEHSFFTVKGTWDPMNNGFPITEITKKRLRPSACEADVKKLYEEIADLADVRPTSNL